MLEAIRPLRLPDWYIAAGAIRNSVWDSLHGSLSPRPHSDLDVIYFDEANAISDAPSVLQAALPEYTWEVTNQATIHHWQSQVAGRDIPAYNSVAAAMMSWPETATAVGVRLSERGTLEFIAPYGLADLFSLTLPPSPGASDPRAYTSRLRLKAWHVRWPRLIIQHEDGGRLAFVAARNEPELGAASHEPDREGRIATEQTSS